MKDLLKKYIDKGYGWSAYQFYKYGGQNHLINGKM